MHALEGLSDDEVWAEIERRRSGASTVIRPIKVEELDTLMASPDTLGEDLPDGDFYARAEKLPAGRSALTRSGRI